MKSSNIIDTAIASTAYWVDMIRGWMRPKMPPKPLPNVEFVEVECFECEGTGWLGYYDDEAQCHDEVPCGDCSARGRVWKQVDTKTA